MMHTSPISVLRDVVATISATKLKDAVSTLFKRWKEKITCGYAQVKGKPFVGL